MLTYFSGIRYSLGWYAGRSMTLLAAGIVLVAMLGEFRRLKSRAEHDAEPLRFLAGIVARSREAIYSVDDAGILTSWNSAAAELYDYRADEVVGAHILMIIPDEELAQWASSMAQVRAGARVEAVETVRRRKDGTLVEISLTNSPVFSASGAVVGASMAARDITDRQAEAQLRRQAIVFDRMTDMVLLTDDSGRIVDCNPSTERISGWGRSDILGTLPGPAPGRTRRPSASPTSASRSRPRTVGRGRHVRDGRGPHGVAECVIVPLRERDGSLGGTILVGRDVRASRAAAGALREAEQRFTQAFTHAPIGGAAHQPVRCGRRDVPERKPGLLRDARLPARGAARAHVRRHHRPRRPGRLPVRAAAAAHRRVGRIPAGEALRTP